MQRLRDLRQYVTDLACIPRLSREELRHLTSRLAAARQGTLSPEQAAQAKQRLIERHLWLAVALVKRSGTRLRQEAEVSTDVALAFLRAQRAGDSHPDRPSIE